MAESDPSAQDGGPSSPDDGEEIMTDGVRQWDRVAMNFVLDLVAQHGWTAVLLLVVWYNCKDPIKRRWRHWQNERSRADANRPERRRVLDIERARIVAERQAEALEASNRALHDKRIKQMDRKQGVKDM